MIQKGQITRFLDWNKIQLAEAETQVTFGVEDIIRNAFVTGAKNRRVIEKPDQPLDAYTVS